MENEEWRMENDGKVGVRVLRMASRLPDGSVTVTTVDLVC